MNGTYHNTCIALQRHWRARIGRHVDGVDKPFPLRNKSFLSYCAKLLVSK
nr:MAG TPA: hypothetical protein [Caudoviricetes sp.]